MTELGSPRPQPYQWWACRCVLPHLAERQHFITPGFSTASVCFGLVWFDFLKEESHYIALAGLHTTPYVDQAILELIEICLILFLQCWD